MISVRFFGWQIDQLDTKILEQMISETIFISNFAFSMDTGGKINLLKISGLKKLFKDKSCHKSVCAFFLENTCLDYKQTESFKVFILNVTDL